MSSVNSAWLEFVLDESIGFLATAKYTVPTRLQWRFTPLFLVIIVEYVLQYIFNRESFWGSCDDASDVLQKQIDWIV